MRSTFLVNRFCSVLVETRSSISVHIVVHVKAFEQSFSIVWMWVRWEAHRGFWKTLKAMNQTLVGDAADGEKVRLKQFRKVKSRPSSDFLDTFEGFVCICGFFCAKHFWHFLLGSSRPTCSSVRVGPYCNIYLMPRWLPI